VKLVACPQCRAQYDVAGIADDTIACRCGARFPAAPPEAVDAAVTRCAACGALVGDAERVCSYCRAAVARHPAPAGPVCPVCYARNPGHARHCTACGVAFLPQPVRRREDPLECPVCPGVRLTARSLAGIWVEECAMCLGLWAPGDVLDRLVERARERRRAGGARPAGPARRERHAAWQAAVSYRRCPECGVRMQRRNFGRRSGVVVDWCASHGAWLDANEMEDIAAFVLEGGLDAGAAPGSDGGHDLAADPARTAAIVEAERLMAEERARTRERTHGWAKRPERAIRSLGDLLAELLK